MRILQSKIVKLKGSTFPKKYWWNTAFSWKWLVKNVSLEIDRFNGTSYISNNRGLSSCQLIRLSQSDKLKNWKYVLKISSIYLESWDFQWKRIFFLVGIYFFMTQSCIQTKIFAICSTRHSFDWSHFSKYIERLIKHCTVYRHAYTIVKILNFGFKVFFQKSRRL